MKTRKTSEDEMSPSTMKENAENYSMIPEMGMGCTSPSPLPWVDCEECMCWYVPVYVTKDFKIQGGELARTIKIQIEVFYEHCLELKGRQQGKLLYTTSLIPKEELKIYINDRYRKTRAENARFSMHSSMRQSVAAVFQSRNSVDSSIFSKNISSIRAEHDTSSSLLGFLFGGTDVGGSSTTETQAGISISSETFFQVLTSASYAVEAERSLTVSSFEEQDKTNITSRVLKNNNDCKAITYYIRRINEIYEYNSKITGIRWRIIDEKSTKIGGWHTLGELGILNNKEIAGFIDHTAEVIYREGKEMKDGRCIALPTDGTFIEAELAYCSSCEPEKMMEVRIRLEKEKAEAELLIQEVERRKKLIAEGKLEAFVKQPDYLLTSKS